MANDSLPDFSTFYRDVHDRDPFPGQGRLADEVIARGWPSLLDLPTGVGKTSALDVAVYAWAAAPERAPRRVFLVVDRRIVVDQATRHAQHICDRLDSGASPEVRRRLREMFVADGECDS